MLSRKGKILLYSSNLWYLGEGMLGPLFAVFAGVVGGNILDITWAWAIYLSVTGILILFIGKLSDGLSKEKILIAGYGLNTLFTFGYLLVDTPYELFIVQAGLGLAAALSIPTWDALYDHHSGDEKDGFIWGLASGEAYLITAVAVIIGGFVVTRFSFSVLFITMGSIHALATLYQARIFFVKDETV